MRSSEGRFLPGQRYGEATEFKPGQHWRKPQPHWDRAWMVSHYVDQKLSTGDIAGIVGCTDANVIYWLRKHGIRRRTISEARAVKSWGASGENNPMYGRFGALNPRFVDGSSPERQRMYARGEGKAFIRDILRRDGYRCQRCGRPNKGAKSLHVHHIKAWAGNRSLRFDPGNVTTLCRGCHGWVHSKKNTEGLYLG